ncbi:hypothetical protein RND81_02G038400 [Saponaria officinalis]|uniref:MYB transcription factor n=1 Tax=Saponaria officinalis TaxID=3572 RepID=A0AAW1MJQ5_SAPOF
MGNPKQKWTAEEEQALRDGVDKYGAGKWKCIHSDPAFSNVLHSRSNIDLKDKWRNLSAANQGTGTRSRPPKPKLTQDASPASAPSTNIRAPAVIPVAPKPATNHVKEEPVKETPDAKIVSRSSNDTVGLIFEALSASTEQNGLDIGSIVSYIEQRITDELPQNFRKQLGARLRRLVQQERLEKVENCYRLKKSSLVSTNAVIRKDSVIRQPLIPAHLKINESLQEAAKTAAYKVAEAEEKTYMAAISVREAERYLKMQEESDAVLQLAQEIYNRLHNNEALIVT